MHFMQKILNFSKFLCVPGRKSLLGELFTVTNFGSLKKSVRFCILRNEEKVEQKLLLKRKKFPLCGKIKVTVIHLRVALFANL